MADEKEQDPNTGRNTAPAIDIPDLKKQKKERKKGGVIIGGGAPGAGAFEGAVGRSAASAAASAAESAAGVAGEAAGELAQGAAQAGGFFARLAAMSSTLGGKLALGAIAAMIAVGVALMERAGGSGHSAGVGAGASSPAELGAISSSIKVRAPRDQGLNYASNSNNGTIKFGNAPKTDKSAKTDAAPAADKTDAAAQSDATEPGPLTNAGGMSAGHSQATLTGAHLSAGLGGNTASTMFKGLDFGKGMASKLGGAFAGGKGQLASGSLHRSGITGSTHVNLGHRGMVNSRAFGQLRSAGLKNGLVTSNSTSMEAASIAADSQFDGGDQTGTPPASPTDSAATANPGGGGGGGGGGSTGGGVVTPVGSGYACTNAQSDAGGVDDGSGNCGCPPGSPGSLTSGCGSVAAAPPDPQLVKDMQDAYNAAMSAFSDLNNAAIWACTILGQPVAWGYAISAANHAGDLSNAANDIATRGGGIGAQYAQQMQSIVSDIKDWAWGIALGGLVAGAIFLMGAQDIQQKAQALQSAVQAGQNSSKDTSGSGTDTSGTQGTVTGLGSQQ